MQKSPSPKKEIDQNDAQPPKKSFFRRLWKLLFYLAVGSVLLLFLLIVSVKIFFPYAKVKKQIEKTLSQTLHTPVEVEDISINPFVGLQIINVHIGKLLSVKKILLDYDLTNLIDKKLVIRNIVVDSPDIFLMQKNGVWNFQLLLGEKTAVDTKNIKEEREKEKPKNNQKEESQKGIHIPLPPIPIQVDLQRFLISNVSAVVKQDDSLSAYLDGLNISIKGKVDNTSNRIAVHIFTEKEKKENISIYAASPSPAKIKTDLSLDLTIEEKNLRTIDVTGTVALQNLFIEVLEKPLKVNLTTAIDLSLALQDESLHIKTISVGIDEQTKIIMAGTVNDFMHSPRITMSLKNTSFSLEELFTHASVYLPDFSDSTIKGDITIPSLNIATTMSDAQGKNPTEVTGTITAKDIAVHLPRFNTTVNGLQLSTDLKKVTLEYFKPKALESNISISLDKAEYNGLFLKSLKNNVTISSSGADLSKNHLQMAMAADIESRHPDYGKINATIASDANIKGNTQTGDVTITDLSFMVKEDSKKKKNKTILKGKVDGTVNNWGKDHFRLQTAISTIKIGPIFDMLPENIVQALDGLSVGGDLSLYLTANGKIPTTKEIEEKKIPVTVDLRTEVKKLHVDWKPLDLTIKSGNIAIGTFYSDTQAQLNGDISIGSIKKKNLPIKNIEDTSFSFSYHLEKLNTFLIKNHTLSIPSLGIQQKLSGKVSGLHHILNKVNVEPIGEVLNSVLTDLKLMVQIDTSPATAIVDNLTAKGTINSYTHLHLLPSSSLSVSGDLKFANLNAAYAPKARITGIDGNIPFRKKIVLSAGTSSIQKKDPIEKSDIFSDLRSYSENSHNLFIDNITAKDMQIKAADFDIYFNENKFSIDNFGFDIFEGSVGGSMSLVAEKDRQIISFAIEYAGINLNTLLKNNTPLPPDQASINGNMNLVLEILSSSKKTEIGDIVLSLNITKIGDYAFDRLLLFLDPEESKPSIASARSALKYASPYTVTIIIKNGNLSVDLQMKSRVLGGKITTISALKRTPFRSLINLNTIQETLSGLSGVTDILQYIAAKRITVDESGKIVLH